MSNFKAVCLLALSTMYGGVEASGSAIYDLGTLGGGSSYAVDINNNGDVVGGSANAAGTLRAFLYSHSSGTMSDLGATGRSQATGINDSGQISGFMIDATGPRAFKYSGGVVYNIGTLGGNVSSGADINASGDVVGDARNAFNVMSAMRYSGSTMSSLGALGALPSSPPLSHANSINSSGNIVGVSTSSSSPTRAFLYSGGVMTDLGTLGGPTSQAFKINDSGQIVGSSYTSAMLTYEHAFLISGGTMTDLGTLGGNNSVAYGINNNGDIVGRSYLAGNTTAHAFVYTGGSMYDLNDLLPAGSPWVLTNAYGINENSQIVGSGIINGEVHAYMMEPGC